MQNKKLKVLYHIPVPSATGADRWIYEGWRDAFNDLGHAVYELTAFDNLGDKAKLVNPDIFMTAINIVESKKNKDVLKKMKENGTKIFLWMHWPIEKSCKEDPTILIDNDLVDIYFGEREADGMGNFEEVFNKKYYVIPNAANKGLHYPVNAVKKYQYDIVYLGARLPMKEWFFKNVLLPLTKKYNVGIFGPYWTVKDNILRALTKASRYIKMKDAVDFFNKLRIVVPPEDENYLYSSAKIALNFHERECDGFQSHKIVNQRTFKIPACGGFQICDHVPAISNYFNNNEIVMADYDKKNWFDLIEYYLNNDKKREEMREYGSMKALSSHTYHNRVDQIVRLYHEQDEQ